MAIQIPITIKTEGERSLDNVADGLKDIDDALADVDSSAGDAKRSLEDVGDATGDVDAKHVDDLSDALKDVDKEAGKADDALKDVDEATKKAGDAGKDLDRDLTGALKNIDDDARKAGKSVGDMDQDFKRAGDATETFRDETRQNLSESVSSFRGDVEDIPQLLQDVLGGVSADLGGIASLAAVGGAAVIGIVIQQLQTMADRVNEAKENMGALALEITETGQGLDGVDFTGRMREWSFAIQDAKSFWEIFQDDAVNNLDNVSEAAEKAGIDLADFWSAMVSPDTEKSLQYLEDLKQKQADIDKQRDDLINGSQVLTQSVFEEAEALKLQSDGYSTLIPEVEKVTDEKIKAYEQSVILRSAEQGVTEEYIEQQDAIAANNAQIETNNDLKNEAIDIASEAFLSEGEYTAAVQESTAAIQENGATLDANTEQGRANREALVNTAGASREFAQAQANAGATQQQVNGILARGRTDFINLAMAAGQSSDEANALADSLGLVPDSVQTEIKTTGAAQAQTDAANVNTSIRNIDDSKTINIKVNTTGMQSAVDDAARRINPPTVIVNARLGRAVAV